MPRNYLLYLKDMRNAAEKILRYTHSISFEAFKKNEEKIDATLHNLEVLGEAAKNVPQEIQDKYPNIPWRNMARFRDVLAHHYFGINLETIWDVVENELPTLITELNIAIAEEDKHDS